MLKLLLFQIFDVMFSSAKQCNSTVVKVYWNGEEINVNDAFAFMPTDYGVCCAFNLGKDEVLKKDVPMQKYFE